MPTRRASATVLEKGGEKNNIRCEKKTLCWGIGRVAERAIRGNWIGAPMNVIVRRLNQQEADKVNTVQSGFTRGFDKNEKLYRGMQIQCQQNSLQTCLFDLSNKHSYIPEVDRWILCLFQSEVSDKKKL